MMERTKRNASSPQATVLVLNPAGTAVTRLTKLISIEYEVILNDVGQLRLECELSETSQAVFLDVSPDAGVPVIVQTGEMETVWLTTNVVEYYDGPRPVIQVVAVSPEKYLEGMFTWPNPYLAPELQVSKRKVTAGPVAVLVKQSILKPNFVRMSWWSGDAFHYVMPHVEADNYTRFTTVSMKMNQSLDFIKTLLDAEGLTLTAELYLPGRGQRKPPGMKGPDRPRLMWDVKQRAELPSGELFFKGLGRSIADFWKHVWEVIAPSSEVSPSAVDYWGKPQLMIRRNQYANLRVETVKPTAWRYTVGGQSPEWLNSLVQMGVTTLINIASGGLGVLLGSSALAEVTKDRIMAYHSFPDLARKKRMGPFGMMETFSPSTGLTIDALSLIKQSQLKSRATRSHEFEMKPTVGLLPGVDYKIGSMLALELPGERYVVAFVTQIKYKWTTTSAPEVTVQVADRPRRDPFDAVMRQVTGLTAMINKVALLEQ